MYMVSHSHAYAHSHNMYVCMYDDLNYKGTSQETLTDLDCQFDWTEKHVIGKYACGPVCEAYPGIVIRVLTKIVV